MPLRIISAILRGGSARRFFFISFMYYRFFDNYRFVNVQKKDLPQEKKNHFVPLNRYHTSISYYNTAQCISHFPVYKNVVFVKNY